MEKQSIALNPNLEALSSADFNKSPLNNQEIAFNSQNFLHSPVKAMLKMVQEAETERRKRKQLEREANRARDKQEELKAIKKAYDWKVKKAENLKLVYAILTSQKHKIELIPHFQQQAFLETVKENLTSVELWLLTEKVEQLHESLKDEIELITSGADPNAYYLYHEYDPEFETVICGHNGKPEYSYGAYLPSLELTNMEDERKLLCDLHCQLNDLAEIEPNQEELETLKQALAA